MKMSPLTLKFGNFNVFKRDYSDYDNFNVFKRDDSD